MSTKSDQCLGNERSRSRTHRHAVVLVLIAVASMLASCTKHPQISFANRHYAAALRTACSAQDATMLTKAKEVIERDHAAGTISPDEVESYRSIIKTAEAGDWQTAERECHRFQKDQLAK